jgi:hypothetical protein
MLLFHLSDLEGRTADPRLYPANFMQDLFSRRLASHGFPQLLVM